MGICATVDGGAWQVSMDDMPECFHPFSAAAWRVPSMTADTELELLLERFDAAWMVGDLDALMDLVTGDCVYFASVGPEPGSTYRGRDDVRRGFAAMLAYDQGRERRGGQAFVSDNKAVAEWSFTETAPDGRQRLIRGCDIFEFAGGKVCKKDAFRKVMDVVPEVADHESRA